MSNLAGLSVSEGGINIKSTHDGDALKVSFAGTAEIPAREALNTMLKQLHLTATELAVREVVVDFNRLEFMNSSCFKSFVTWINDVQEQPADKQYKIRFQSNPEMLWQRRSMHALKCFATELISVES